MRKYIAKAVQYFSLFLVLAVFLVPLLIVFNTSLKTEPEFLKNTVSVAKSFQLQNYAAAWNKANMGSYIVNSLIYVVVVDTVSIIMAVLLAFPIARKSVRFTGILYTVFVAGLFLPNGTIPLWQMLLKADLYNTRLGYILTMINGGGVTLMFFVSYIKGLPKELDEASAIDGCGYFRYIFKILTPLMKPAISSMVILTTINVWNEIVNSLIFLSDEKLYPITRGLYVFKGQYSVQWTQLTAALIIVAMPLILLYLLMQRYIIDGVVAGGVKA
jgi:raffinose/stachyose/melibiose transport system permease protein